MFTALLLLSHSERLAIGVIGRLADSSKFPFQQLSSLEIRRDFDITSISHHDSLELDHNPSFIKMVMLQELPTELLSQIFSYLVWDKQLLRNLALQCQCFSLAVRPILLQNVALTPNGGPKSLTLELFNRTICEKPLLASMVQSLSIIWSESSLELPGNIDSLLNRLTALRFLKVQNSSDHAPFRHNFLNANDMSHLTDVALNDTSLTVEVLVRYFFLENIHRLSVLWLRNPAPPTFDLLGYPETEWSLPSLPKGKPPGSSTIADLDLGPVFHLPEPVLKEILSWPKGLRRLRSTIPGQDGSGRFGVSKQLLTTLSPESISRALSPAKDTLEDLELIDVTCEWPGHDETKMDLRNFKALAKIWVPSTCFFKNFTNGVKREGMCELLPPSLVDLKIVYDLNDCIRPDAEERGPLSLQSHNIEDFIDLELLTLGTPNDLKWLMELAENKRECFPNLKRVSLIERCGLLRSGVHPTNWNLPSTIADAFAREGIEFRAVMRMNSPAPTFD